MKRKARLKDIAEALNISTTTVSRALNNKDDISDSTKKAVLEVAKILNYRPNYFAKSLHNNQNHLIGVVVPRVNHSFYSQMIDGILYQAQKNGYVVLLAESMDSDKLEKQCIDEFLDINIAALIIAPSYDSALLDGYIIDGIDREKVVICDRSSEKIAYNSLSNNHATGAYKATMQLIKSGLNKIGHIRGLTNDRIADQIHIGYLKAITEAQKEPYTYQCAIVNPEESYKATSVLYEKYRVEGILAVSDEAALGVYRYCFEHAISIPSTLSVVGFSNAHFSQYLTPSLSTVDQQSRAMGINAIDIINTKTQHSLKAESINIDTIFIKRESSFNTDQK